MPRFSILMPTMGKRSLLIDQAIEAILSQDFKDFELIIKNNGADFEVPDDKRIIYVNKMDISLADSLNQALELATGEIVTEQNDDDRMAPGVLSLVDKEIEGFEWLYGKIYMSNGSYMGEPWDYQRLKTINFVPQPSVFFRRSRALEVGGFDLENPLAADYDMWLKLGAQWQPKFLEKILAYYTIHPGQLTQTNLDDQLATAKRVKEKYS